MNSKINGLLIPTIQRCFWLPGIHNLVVDILLLLSAFGILAQNYKVPHEKPQTTVDNSAEDCSMAKEFKYYCTKLCFLTWCLVMSRFKTVFYVSFSLKSKKEERYKHPRFSSHICYSLSLYCVLVIQ